ncbi:hypothetical protein AB1K18_04215 [Peribacillus simplex]|uniref:hypothetical protein n=1 Tax=Peribacillus simplex TaxID=1478 RepID=UPI003B8B3E1D
MFFPFETSAAVTFLIGLASLAIVCALVLEVDQVLFLLFSLLTALVLLRPDPINNFLDFLSTVAT